MGYKKGPSYWRLGQLKIKKTITKIPAIISPPDLDILSSLEFAF
jgi:hypothetical protein